MWIPEKVTTFAPNLCRMKINFCSLSSGSSGNCYYLGNEFSGILIDAGISAGAISKFLKGLNIPMEQIMGILVTHNHSDHIKGLRVLTRRHHIPVFTTETVWRNVMMLSSQKDIPNDCIRKISPLKQFHLAGFDIEAFPVSHDVPETLGFHICCGQRHITIVTDLGHICNTAAKFIQAADFLVIEANYDEEMLTNGGYPQFLKDRIRSNNGHLDNMQTASFLADTIHADLSHICLAHLSKNNNTPEQALLAVHKTLSAKGINLNIKPKISVLKRDIPSEFIILED